MTSNKNFFTVMAILVTLTFFSIYMLGLSWERNEKENNEFARLCNEKGGRAEIQFGMKQCIPSQGVSK